MLDPGGQLPLRTLKAAVVGSCGFALFLGRAHFVRRPSSDELTIAETYSSDA
jgi:hypothetical protein